MEHKEELKGFDLRPLSANEMASLDTILSWVDIVYVWERERDSERVCLCFVVFFMCGFFIFVNDWFTFVIGNLWSGHLCNYKKVYFLKKLGCIMLAYKKIEKRKKINVKNIWA